MEGASDRAVAHQGRGRLGRWRAGNLLRVHAEDFRGDFRIHRLLALPEGPATA